VIDEVELAPDYRISRLIRGGWQQHAAGTLDPVAEAQNLHAFANAGITAFETADTYRGVDSALARMLAERRAAGQALPRIHTRITLPRDVGEAVAETSRRLGQDVLDLVQLQSWGPDRAALTEAALRLRELSSQGRLRHVGLMNVDADIAAGIVGVGAKPLTVQAQCSLLDRRAFATLAPFAVESRIHLLAYGPLAGGFLTERWLGRPDPGLAPGRDVHFHKEYRIVIEEFGGPSLGAGPARRRRGSRRREQPRPLGGVARGLLVPTNRDGQERDRRRAETCDGSARSGGRDRARSGRTVRPRDRRRRRAP
jgi:aryl-alcohol dehydrogenase-like predicted oxidoreductase